MKINPKESFVRHTWAVTLLVLACLALFTLTARGEMYVGRQDGQVIWSFDSASGELRVYGDCGSQVPTWQPLASQIQSVFIAPGTTRIPDAAFRSCTRLTELTVPTTVTIIGAYAFDGCSSLRTLTLPEGLGYIGEYALRGCTSLTSLIYTGSSESWETLCERTAAVQENDTLTGRTPIYTRPTCMLSVSYIDAETGKELAPRVTRTVTVGAATTVISPEIEGYVPDEQAVVMTNATFDTDVVVRYERTHCALYIHFVDEQGKDILPTRRLSVERGRAVTISAPEAEGYLPPVQREITLESIEQDGTSHTFSYTTKRFSVTVHCLDELGQTLCEPLVVSDIRYGGSYRVTLPELQGYVRPSECVEGDDLTESITLSCRYAPQYLSLVIHYVDELGNPLCDSDRVTLRYGTTLSRIAPDVPGYWPQQASLYLPAVTDDEPLSIVYRRAQYTMTVLHLGEDGTLLQQNEQTLFYGQPYQLLPLSHEGYELPSEQSAALSGTMPAAHVTVALRYRAREASQPQIPPLAEPPSDTPADAPPEEGTEEKPTISDPPLTDRISPWWTIGGTLVASLAVTLGGFYLVFYLRQKRRA